MIYDYLVSGFHYNPDQLPVPNLPNLPGAVFWDLKVMSFMCKFLNR